MKNKEQECLPFQERCYQPGTGRRVHLHNKRIRCKGCIQNDEHRNVRIRYGCATSHKMN
nr:MAG TPA: hypothetical protein [Caudoviricetes sp.]